MSDGMPLTPMKTEKVRHIIFALSLFGDKMFTEKDAVDAIQRTLSLIQRQSAKRWFQFLLMNGVVVQSESDKNLYSLSVSL